MIDDGMFSLGELSEKPTGMVRITTTEHATTTVIWSLLQKILPDYPNLHVELAIDSRLTDIVSERFDAGVRLKETIARDMIAVPVSSPLRMAAVGASSYLEHRTIP